MFGNDLDPLQDFGCDQGSQIGVVLVKEFREAVEVGKRRHGPFQLH